MVEYDLKGGPLLVGELGLRDLLSYCRRRDRQVLQRLSEEEEVIHLSPRRRRRG